MSPAFHCRCGKSFRLKSRTKKPTVTCPKCGRKISVASGQSTPQRDDDAKSARQLPNPTRQKRKRTRSGKPELKEAPPQNQDDRHFLLTILLGVAMLVNGMLALNSIGKLPFLLMLYSNVDNFGGDPPQQYDDLFTDSNGDLIDGSLKWQTAKLMIWAVVTAAARAAVALAYTALYFFWRAGLPGAIIGTVVVGLLEGLQGDPTFALNSVLLCAAIVAMMFYLQPVTWSQYRKWEAVDKTFDTDAEL